MKRLLLLTLFAASLSGCYCKPEAGEAVGSNYVTSCFKDLKAKAPKR